MRFLVIIFSCLVAVHGQESVVFPSGEVLVPTDPSTIAGEAANVNDPKNTGALLFNAEAYHERRLTPNFYTKDFRSQNSPYFRAHPVFMTCLQRIRNRLQADDKIVELVSGFKTQSDTGSSSKLQDLYARSGCGAELKFKDGTNADILELAEAAISQCTRTFSLQMRDIGVVLKASSIHVHMTGEDDKQPQFVSDGHSMSNADFKEWCLNKLEKSISPVRGPDCSPFPGLVAHEVYPTGATSPEEIVGQLDEKITRTSPDFKRLVQYMGRNIVFDDSESGASWCGQPDNPCVSCMPDYNGNAPSTRCADRMMSYRLYGAMVTLQKLVQDVTPNKLRVEEAWDEPYAGKPEGDSTSPTSLHFEGRAAKLKMTGGNTEEDMETLSWLAICSGMDYVHNKGDHVFVAVRRQADLQARTSQFTTAELLHVLPPTSKADMYKIDKQEEKDHPLFDSDHRTDAKLGQFSTIGMFKSKSADVRYFRLDPALSACFDGISLKEQMLSSGQDKVKVMQGFMASSEQTTVLGAVEEEPERYNKHNYGIAMVINYDPAPSNHSGLLRMAKSAIDRCAYVFFNKGKQMGLGLYSDGLYIDMRDRFDLWKGNEFVFPPGINEQDYNDEMRTRYDYAMRNRIIDPDDLEAVCRRSVPPQRQSPDFQHRHPQGLVQHRKKRAAGQLTQEQCTPNTNTAFCQQTTKHRQEEVETIWRQVKRKHLFRNEDEVKAALEGCFGVCGTCVTGQVYEDKTEHCNNFLHWVPFDLMNEDQITNLYTRSNLDVKRHACYAGEHCVDLSPLFSLIMPTFNQRYRPDPNKSPEEELYSLSDNPSPAFELLYRLYALHANGSVKVWVKDEAELSTLRLPLQMIMAFNRDVTDLKFYVSDTDRMSDVSSLLESMIAEWVKSTCTHWGREFIPPFTMEQIPAGISKRSAEAWAAREEFIRMEHNWEQVWLQKSYN